MAPRKQPGAAKARSVAEVQAEVDAQVRSGGGQLRRRRRRTVAAGFATHPSAPTVLQMQQLEGLLTGGEKKVKNMSLAFNNRQVAWVGCGGRRPAVGSSAVGPAANQTRLQ